MENNRLIAFGLLALALVFPQYLMHLAVAALAIELAFRYVFSVRKEKCDKQALELLFRLSVNKEISEAVVVSEMKGKCFERFAKIYEKTSKLVFPKYGWRSYAVVSAIRAVLETGDSSVLVKALEQISRQEEAEDEAKSVLSSQKYTLIASMAVSSAIIGVVSSISGQGYLYYVLAQSVLSAIWLKFLGNNFYESLSFSVPLSLTGYFIALRFV